MAAERTCDRAEREFRSGWSIRCRFKGVPPAGREGGEQIPRAARRSSKECPDSDEPVSKAAQLESQRAVRTGVQTIRQTEAGELAALRRDYDARLNRAATNYANAIGRVEDFYDGRNAALRRQIASLRKQKAKAEGALRKA